MAARGASHLIGLVSDTHGTLDPRVAGALAGCERILHAGDVGRPEVLWELRTLAPVDAVRGNTDHWQVPGEELSGLVRLDLDGVRIAVVHDRSDLPAATVRESDVVVFGHSHRPLVQELDGVLWVNPGSATQPRGSKLGRSVGLLELAGGARPAARIVPLSEFGEVS